jgi:hypothetical protein
MIEGASTFRGLWFNQMAYSALQFHGQLVQYSTPAPPGSGFEWLNHLKEVMGIQNRGLWEEIIPLRRPCSLLHALERRGALITKQTEPAGPPTSKNFTRHYMDYVNGQHIKVTRKKMEAKYHQLINPAPTVKPAASAGDGQAKGTQESPAGSERPRVAGNPPTEASG